MPDWIICAKVLGGSKLNIYQRVLDIAVEIQQIPAPTFKEEERSNFIQELFNREKLNDVNKDNLGNVFGRIPGAGKTQPIIVTAHSDTVFPIETDLTITRKNNTLYGPGIGDNSLGVAGLFGLIWQIKQKGSILPGDLWLVANVCEEGLGDLKGMRVVVDRFGKEPLAYIVLEGMALGQIYHRALGVQRYRITARGTGGHSWVDYGRPSAIHELAALVTRISALELPEKPRTTLNVGVIDGGTSVNTIAAEASLQLDLRSTDQEALKRVIHQIETLTREYNHPGMDFEIEVIGRRPAGEISRDHPLVKLAVEVHKSHGISPTLNIGSTDANIPLSLRLPAICVGLTTGSAAHTMNEYIHTKPLKAGLSQLIDLIYGVFQTDLKQIIT